jgi:hypothetical protein
VCTVGIKPCVFRSRHFGLDRDDGLDILFQGLSISTQKQPLPYICRTILEFVFSGDEGIAWREGLGGLCQGFGLQISCLSAEDIQVLSNRLFNLNFI